ncbi:glycosyltransferase family 61 protein [Pararhodospirillum oryzae]|uniref:Glycosyltransferase 61 catalytic domain-containing protein n=1 Tax=Pararhodospirillum oryzae TaxID=478448 RepID=A0A512H7T6_9PROT|nr:glycosyltransferase 61 family protein [Pararhodospirillum oryzae]GEO81517.1 hypothetical protein ROR02_16480 [Pararhodospirillum oryzae]
MTLRTFEYVPIERWCRPVPALAGLQEPDTVCFVRPGQTVSVPLPDLVLDSNDVAAITDGRPWGFPLDPGPNGEALLSIEPAFLARLDGVTIDRLCSVPFMHNPFNIFVRPGLALDDTYNGSYGTSVLKEQMKEWVDYRVGNQSVKIKLYEDLDPDQRVDGEALFVAGRFSFGNYFHWIVDSLSRLWAISKFNPPESIPILLPTGSLNTYQRETLEALGLKNKFIMLNCRRAFVEKLYFSSYFSPGGYTVEQVNWLSSVLRRAFKVEGRKAGRRLYVSRADARARRVRDEAALVASLQARGFEVVTLGGLSVREQAILFAEADIVVAPHGAGNTNMLFARPEAALIEIVPAQMPQPCYWMLTRLRGQHYGRLLDRTPDPGDGDLTVDLGRLHAMLDLAFAQMTS